MAAIQAGPEKLMQLCPPVDSVHTKFANVPVTASVAILPIEDHTWCVPLDPLPGLGRAESAVRAALGPGGEPAPASKHCGF